MALENPQEGLPVTEGLRGENLFATRLGGPALALNPHWALDIASDVLASRGLEPARGEFHQRVEAAAAEARGRIIRRLGSAR